jgi:hypothetical protein
MKILVLILICNFALVIETSAQSGVDKDLVNLLGSVHSVRLESAILTCESGKCVNSGRRAKGGFSEYDSMGNLTDKDRSRFSREDPQERIRRYPFGDGPSFIEKANLEENGTLIYTHLYFFNNLSRQAEWLIRNPDNSIKARIVNSFNMEGRLAESIAYDSNMQIFARTTYIYDDKGNQLEITNYEKDNIVSQVILFEYEFDSMGNWVKQIMTFKKPVNGEMQVSAIKPYYRTITYY